MCFSNSADDYPYDKTKLLCDGCGNIWSKIKFHVTHSPLDKNNSHTTEKFSPKWLLNNIRKANSDGEALLCIIEFQNEITKQA
jgi:hypothetical protein